VGVPAHAVCDHEQAEVGVAADGILVRLAHQADVGLREALEPHGRREYRRVSMTTSNDAGELVRRIAAEKTVRLVTRGGRSGQPRQVTIWFVVIDGAIGIGTLNDDRNWVKNARSAGEVELVFAGGRLRGRFTDVADAERHARIRAGMAQKYWPARIASWF